MTAGLRVPGTPMSKTGFNPDEIGRIAGDAGMTPGEICERLIAIVNARGGTDNVTCVVMRFGVAANQG